MYPVTDTCSAPDDHLFVCRNCISKGRGGLPVDDCQCVQLIKDAVSLFWGLLLCKACDGGRWGCHNAPGFLQVVVQQPARRSPTWHTHIWNCLESQLTDMTILDSVKKYRSRWIEQPVTSMWWRNYTWKTRDCEEAGMHTCSIAELGHAHLGWIQQRLQPRWHPAVVGIQAGA